MVCFSIYNRIPSKVYLLCNLLIDPFLYSDTPLPVSGKWRETLIHTVDFSFFMSIYKLISSKQINLKMVGNNFRICIHNASSWWAPGKHVGRWLKTSINFYWNTIIIRIGWITCIKSVICVREKYRPQNHSFTLSKISSLSLSFAS